MRKSVILESIEIAENKELSADIYMASGWGFEDFNSNLLKYENK
jgi:hypothetical protein